MIKSAWDSISAAIYSALVALINILPDSPFEYLAADTQIYQILKYVNWIIPIRFMLSSMGAWLAAIAIYYVYSIIMRWIKAID